MEEVGADNNNYDILDTNLESENDLNNGIRQELDVDGEDFKLVIEYYCGDNEWRITADKKLYMSICTQGLDESKEVYIDTIHMDTFIVSNKAYYDGIKQDTLDDHIHNSLMIGFPISDTSSYYGINEIEGQNSEFIEGYTYGYAGYHNGEIETKRRLESDYLSDAVWANKISGVVGLLIKDKETGEIRGVDVDTTLMVAVNNKITFLDDGEYITYEYDRNGNSNKVSSSKNLVKEK